MYRQIIDKILDHKSITAGEITSLLALEDAEKTEYLYSTANALKHQEIGNKVFLRGLIEFSNICTRDCLYCGIRKSNPIPERYTMNRESIMRSAIEAIDAGYGSVVLQSGERNDPAFTRSVTDIVRKIKKYSSECGITLSCGEQTPEIYSEWHDAGAERYLLRIETTNRELFRKIHCRKSDFDLRLAALENLQKTGFITGTGVMIGLPGQTISDLAGDLIFFAEMDVDMIGMGPFIPSPETPMGQNFQDSPAAIAARVRLTLNMIAVARLMLRDVNIASTTALQTISPDKGLVSGIKAGANVIMPNTGDINCRKNYMLYANKVISNTPAKEEMARLREILEKSGETIATGVAGHPAHYSRRNLR